MYIRHILCHNDKTCTKPDCQAVAHQINKNLRITGTKHSTTVMQEEDRAEQLFLTDNPVMLCQGDTASDFRQHIFPSENHTPNPLFCCKLHQAQTAREQASFSGRLLQSAIPNQDSIGFLIVMLQQCH